MLQQKNCWKGCYSMIGMAYVRMMEMVNKDKKHTSKNPYARIKEWKLFRKRIIQSKKKYDRNKFKIDKRKDLV